MSNWELHPPNALYAAAEDAYMATTGNCSTLAIGRVVDLVAAETERRVRARIAVELRQMAALVADGDSPQAVELVVQAQARP